MPSLMEARDAIVSWLEQGDHFVRVTAASPFSPSTREAQALHELAAFVNRALPRAQWDARHAKQMLKHYLLEFRSTASATVPLGEKESRCRHFSRLQTLHDSKRREQESNAHTPEADKAAMKQREEVVTTRGEEEGDKRAKPKKEAKKHKVPTPGFSELVSDEEEELPTVRRATRAKRRATKAAVKAAHKDETPRYKAQPTKHAASGCTTSSYQVSSRKSTHGTVPESLRSAIAEVVSQRQQLLDSRRNDPESQDSASLQTRQRSLSDSDYGLSDIDLPSVNPKPSASNNFERNSKTSYEPRHDPGPPEGLVPLLTDWSYTNVSKSNLKRKRVFLSAKQLAFEQLKWYRENELQQGELELLRREMATREVLGQQELKLKRMRIRADIIQPMISAGASIADIAERLKLL